MKKTTPTMIVIIEIMTIISLMIYVSMLIAYIENPNPGIKKIGITALVIWIAFRYLKPKEK